MVVRIPGRYVEAVEHPAALGDVARDVGVVRQLCQQTDDHMTPGFAAEAQVKRLHGLLGGLMRCEARPLVPTRGGGIVSLGEITFGLPPPVLRSIRPGTLAPL